MRETHQFPRGFLWGAATASHQVEGDNRWNDWWEYEQSGRLPHISSEACRHYQLFDRDFALARSWGHNCHRLSIEWSRIKPTQGSWNTDAVAHYNTVIQSLRKHGLEPIVTLHHFTNPSWFRHAGGWLRKESATLFSRYAQYVAEHLDAEVKYWLTINEPTIYVIHGYIKGEWPPCRKSSRLKAVTALMNLARAHVAAYKILKRNRPDSMVSFAHSAPLITPCNSDRKRDRMAAWLRDLALNRAFFYLIGATPKAKTGRINLDFIGLNYYTRTIVTSTNRGIGAIVGLACHNSHHRDRGPTSATGMEIYPLGLRTVLRNFSRFGLPILVTENGVATDDEHLRHDFILQHLEHLARAIEEGVDVIGYLYWTLMDNFEWALGTSVRYGLAAVDFGNQQRLPRPCVKDFERVCRNNRL